MSAMRVAFLRNPGRLAAVGALAALLAAAGCVREVLKGEDPEARAGRLTGQNSKDALVVVLPWMSMPAPRLLRDGAVARAEVVYATVPGGKTRYTLREPSGISAIVDARAKQLPDAALEFEYEVVRLPPGLSVDVPIAVSGEGSRPDAVIAVNGAPARVAPDDRVVVVLLARDEPTRIVATPKPAPVPAPAPSTKP